MIIRKSKIVYKNKNKYLAFPSIINLDSNRFLLMFRYAHKEADIDGKPCYSHLHSLSKIKAVEVDRSFNMKREFFLASDDEAAKQDSGLFRISQVFMNHIQLIFFIKCMCNICQYIRYRNFLAL